MTNNKNTVNAEIVNNRVNKITTSNSIHLDIISHLLAIIFYRIHSDHKQCKCRNKKTIE